MTDLNARIKLRRGVRSHVVAVTNALAGEPYYSTDTREFFIGDGSGVPQPVSAGGARSSVAYTTASLASGASEVGNFTVPKAYSILRLVTDYAARVRVYMTSAQRDADAARSSSTDPTGNHGCILEVVTTGAVLTLDLSPVAVGASPTDGTVAYISVANLDAASRAITSTFSVLSMEG